MMEKAEIAKYLIVCETFPGEKSNLVYQYPEPVKVEDPDTLMNYMRLEGCLKQKVDVSAFILHQKEEEIPQIPSPVEEINIYQRISEYERLRELCSVKIPVFFYQFQEDVKEWQLWDSTNEVEIFQRRQPMSLSLSNIEKHWTLQIIDGSRVHSIEIHSKIDYTVLYENFVSMMQIEGYKIGLEFSRVEDQLKLQDLFEFIFESKKELPPIKLEEINQNSNTLYFINVVISYNDKKYPKGLL